MCQSNGELVLLKVFISGTKSICPDEKTASEICKCVPSCCCSSPDGGGVCNEEVEAKVENWSRSLAVQENEQSIGRGSDGKVKYWIVVVNYTI